MVGLADLGIEGGFGRDMPSPGRDLAGGAVAEADVVPETPEIGRIGKDAADPDNCYR